MLTSIQKDVLTEILNIQIGAAANILSEMVSQKVILSVPQLELIGGDTVDFDLLKYQQMSDITDAIATKISFSGQFCGSAAIVIPRDKASSLVNVCLGAGEAEDTDVLSEEYADVIKEICNIILNSLLGKLGNIMEVRLEYTSLEVGSSIELWDSHDAPPDAKVLVLYTSFFLTNSQVRGIVLIALSPGSFDMLVGKIDEMLRDINV